VYDSNDGECRPSDTNALAAFVLLAANRPSVYLTGGVLYLITEGLCAARFTALLVDIVGPETRDASTFYSALSAAGSIPVVYMIWLDGVGFRKFGMRGLLWADAAANLLVFAVVASAFAVCGLSLRRAPHHRFQARHPHPEQPTARHGRMLRRSGRNGA